MDRNEMVKKILWLSDRSGASFGVTSFASMAIWDESEEELKSVVAITGPSNKYSDEEIQKLYKFSVERTKKHDKICRSRIITDMIIFDKMSPDFWYRAKMDWNVGSLVSETLDDAIAFFTRKYDED